MATPPPQPPGPEPLSAGSVSSAVAIFSRASGERSSCEAFASSERCARTSVSIRSAERLKLAASAATSSRPCTGTRADRSPEPSASTPRCSRSSRRVSRRTIG